MERAKRLEGSSGNTDTISDEQSYADVSKANTPLSTLATPNVTDLAEIVNAWPTLSEEVRTAVMTLVRLSR
jgi:hypothetical protein